MNEMLMMQLGVTQAIFQVNTDEVTHEESLLLPAESGNCLNWIAGHLVTAYNSILPSLGEETVWDEANDEIYKRGSDPLTGTDRGVDFGEICSAFDAAHERMMRGLGNLAAERLAEPAPVAITRGRKPSSEEKAVMRMGRKRSLDASTAASTISSPWARRSRANSTMRMAFLLAMATRSTRPICM